MQLRDFNYVDDCVEAFLLAGASEAVNGKVFNLGSAEVVDLKTVAEMMLRLRPDAKYELVPFPTDRKAIDIGDYYSDFSLITKELGWAPKNRLVKRPTKDSGLLRCTPHSLLV